MSELSGLELRKAACEALGWDVIEDQFLSNDSQRLTGIGRPQGRGTTQALPAIESDSAVSEPMFLEWIVSRNFAWEMTSNMPGSFWLDVADAETRLNDSCVHIRVHGATPSEARARAIAKTRENK